jgi:hypothetical protein
MKHNILGIAALLALTQTAHAKHCHVTVPRPPPGYVAYHATMYGNERGWAGDTARRLPASGIPFRANAHTFAMYGALNQKFKVWTPGHRATVAYCTDVGAYHPDLAYGFFREMYYETPSRHMSYTRAGTMTIWMKRISGHVDSPTWRTKHKHRR